MGTWGLNPWQSDSIHDHLGNDTLYNFFKYEIKKINIKGDMGHFDSNCSRLRGILDLLYYCGKYMDSPNADKLLERIYPKFTMSMKFLEKAYARGGQMSEDFYQKVQEEYAELEKNIKEIDTKYR